MDYKDICVTDRQVPVHQLNKLNEKGTKREDFFPISVVQAIFDKTGIRLDAIISSFNYLFLPWKGTKEATRLQVVGLMRRKSLVICYRDLDDNIIIEMYISNERGDNEWKKGDNWKDFEDWITQVISDILGDLDEYPDIYEIIKNIIDDKVSEELNTWITENAEQIINNYLDKLNISDIINNIITEYLSSEDFNTLVNNMLNNYLGENLQPAIDEYFEKIQTYITNNERVIGNALSRHEEDLITIKGE